MNEQIHASSGDEDSSPNGTNHGLVLSPSGCDELKEYAHDKITLKTTALRGRPLMREPLTICNGSTLKSVPSATNLLLPSQTRERHHSCYETSNGYAFHDKTNEAHNYSDTNYVLHVLGGGTCNHDGFESFPRHASKNIIVTAYYKIPSKHPPNKYNEWMENFLSVYQDSIVVFTSPNLVGVLANLRRRNKAKICEKSSCDPSSMYFDTIIVALPLEELPLAKLYSQSFWIDQLDRDPQSSIHSPLRGDPRMQGNFESGELYWIWLSKVWFVTETTKILGTNTKLEDQRDPNLGSGGLSNSNTVLRSSSNDGDVFAWIDIGSFRNEDPTAKNENPPPLLLRYPEVVPATEMLFWSHSSAHSSPSSDSIRKMAPAKNYAPIPPRESPYFDDKSLRGGKYFFHSGAHFAGRPRSISRFYRQFLQTIDAFVERNLTLADDQAVMQSSCLSYYYESHVDDDRRKHGCDKRPKNLCAYATRDMVGGKSKWFGLTKLLQTGWAETNKVNGGINRSGNPDDLYWRPPPPVYYLEHKNQSIEASFNCSKSA